MDPLLIILVSIVCIYVYHKYDVTVTEYECLSTITAGDIQTGDIWMGCFNPVRERNVSMNARIVKLLEIYHTDAIPTHVGLCYRDSTDRLFVMGLIHREDDEPYRMKFEFGKEGLRMIPFEVITAMYDYVTVRKAPEPIPNDKIGEALNALPDQLLKGADPVLAKVRARLKGEPMPEGIPRDKMLCSEHVYAVLDFCGMIDRPDIYPPLILPGDYYESASHDSTGVVKFKKPYGPARRFFCTRESPEGKKIQEVYSQLLYPPLYIEAVFGEPISAVKIPRTKNDASALKTVKAVKSQV